TAYEKKTTKSVHRLFWEASSLALRSAGLRTKDVDGISAVSLGLPPDNVATLAEHFGIESRWCYQGVYGGASGIIGMLHAARAIQAGDANVVLCGGADRYDNNVHLNTER